MADIKKIIKGLECCQISMSEKNPFAKCDICPYQHFGIAVQDCRSILSGNCLELIRRQQDLIKMLKSAD